MKTYLKTAFLSLAVICLLGGALTAPMAAAASSTTVQTLAPAVRAKLIEVKQNVAFAENLQKEARSDPEDIFKSLDNSVSILDKLIADPGNKGISDQLAIIRDAILRIRENVKEPGSYTEVRTLLEIMTGNPKE